MRIAIVVHDIAADFVGFVELGLLFTDIRSPCIRSYPEWVMQPSTRDIPEMLDGYSRVTIAAIGE
jgi:hypothetical protein